MTQTPRQLDTTEDDVREEVAADYEKLMELSKLLEDLQKQQEEQYEIWEELESMAE